MIFHAMNIRKHNGITLIELLVAMSVMLIVVGLVAAAIMKVRSSAMNVACLNNMRQIGLAMNLYHNNNHSFPSGHHSLRNTSRPPMSGWTMDMLPYIEQRALHTSMTDAYKKSFNPFNSPPHTNIATVVKIFACPSDGRALTAQYCKETETLAGLTSYLGVSGTDTQTKDGVLYQDSRIRISDITGGTSSTMLVGERPPSYDFKYGWWYAGTGQHSTGSLDLILGVMESKMLPIYQNDPCAPGRYPYQKSSINDYCGAYHFWSLHNGGGHFLFADGSTKILSYSIGVNIIPLATRDQSEGLVSE